MKTKIEFIAETLCMSVDQIEREWDVRNVSLPFIDEMLEEYGKYCAEKAWRGIMFHIPMPITNKSFEDWWDEFKEETK